MLEELRVRNFAVIDQLELRFGAGLNVITGETGAGKSILIDAVELLLGARADPAFVRAGSERSVIEGIIRLDLRNRSDLLALLQREDLLDADNDDYLTLSREIRVRGRSGARVNGVAVNAALLNDIGELLFDIHGQSEHLSLLRPRNHIDLLDRYADLLDIRAGLAKLVDELTGVQGEMRRLFERGDASKRRADLLRHELGEIAAAALDADEEATLLAERVRLANSEQLARLASEAAMLLDGDDRGGQLSAVDGLMGVAAALAKLSAIDDEMSGDHELAESLAQGAQELALTLTRYAADAEFDPARLDEVEERLELIKALKRRFGADSIADVLAYAEKAARELERIDHSDERLLQLRGSEGRLLASIGDICQRLSEARAKAGAQLSAAIVRELRDLRMEQTRFEVRLAGAEHPAGCIVGDKRYKFDAKGMDDVEFMLSANPGGALAAVGQGGIGRRSRAHHAGAEAGAIRCRSNAGLDLRRGRSRHRRTPRRGGGRETLGAGARSSGAVRDASAAAGGIRRPAFSRAKADPRIGRGDGSPRTGRRWRAHRRTGGDAGRGRRSGAAIRAGDFGGRAGAEGGVG